VCDGVDPFGDFDGALFCNLPPAAITAMADSIPRVQSDCLCVAGGPDTQPANSNYVPSEGHQRQRYMQINIFGECACPKTSRYL